MRAARADSPATAPLRSAAAAQSHMAPAVTVLMPVHNGAPYLKQAIESILAQTFSDFEFLIIDDGSTDDSSAIVSSYTDPRIRLTANPGNLGLTETLNSGMRLARGRYVARMDCDDISHRRRLATQVAFMDAHGEVAVCGTWIRGFGAERFVKRYPLDDARIRAHLLFENAIAHPSAMLRRSVFIQLGLSYASSYANAEDYELWTRVPSCCKLANIDRILLYYRRHARQVSVEGLKAQSAVTATIRKRQLAALGLELTEESVGLHAKVSRKIPELSPSFLERAERWLATLREKNEVSRIYDPDALAEMAGLYWWETCFHATALGSAAWRSYFRSPLSRKARIDSLYQLLFLVKCLLRKSNNSRAA